MEDGCQTGHHPHRQQIVPRPLWNACDYVIQFHFVVAQISEAQNTATCHLSRLKADPKDKFIMKNREVVQTLPNEINVPSLLATTTN